MDGLLIVNKPVSFSSFDIVKIVRNTTGIRKIGHTGTLDKEAEGLLVLCIGKATKLVESFMDKEKEYEAEGKLGESKDTDDASGNLIEKREVSGITASDIERILGEFVGETYQIPPMFSSIKVKGQRLYKIARSGKTVKREPRKVYVKSIDLLSYSLPYFKIRVVCGRGFYIRALIRDIGERLGVGAYTKHLVRTKLGDYTLKHAINIDDIRDREKITSCYIPIEQVIGVR